MRLALVRRHLRSHSFGAPHRGARGSGSVSLRSGLVRARPRIRPINRTRPAPTYEDRCKMLELACHGDPRLVVSRIEAGPGKSYSIDTIEKLRAAGKHPSFIIGADAFAEIATWHRWQDLVSLTDFIVVTRPGHRYDSPPGAHVERLDTLAPARLILRDPPSARRRRNPPGFAPRRGSFHRRARSLSLSPPYYWFRQPPVILL